jgi:hypothetical protein
MLYTEMAGVNESSAFLIGANASLTRLQRRLSIFAPEALARFNALSVFLCLCEGFISLGR